MPTDNPRYDWGLPEYPSNPPREDVRDESGRGCPFDFAVLVSPLVALCGLAVTYAALR